MFDHLPSGPVLPTGRAGLLGPGGLQQPFLRVDPHAPTALPLEAVSPQRARRADVRREAEEPPAAGPGPEVAALLPTRAPADAGLQVQREVALREPSTILLGWDLGDQPSSGVGEQLPRRAIPVGTIGQGLCHRTAGGCLALLH